jgi:hypothetical protein
LKNPTWSPDSHELAYSLADGIHILGVPDSLDCTQLTERTIAPGGSEPDWGPADVNPAQKPSPATPTPSTPAPPAFKLSGVKLSPSTFRAAASGPAITSTARGTKLSFTVSQPAKVVIKVSGAKGSIKTAAKPGANSLRFMGRVAKRTVRPGRHVMTLKAAPLAGGKARSATVKFRIVR